MSRLNELNVAEAFNPKYQEIVEAIGIEATIELHKAFNGRRILCVKHLYDIDYIVKLATQKSDNKYIERLVYETGYSFDWLKRKIREHYKMSKNLY